MPEPVINYIPSCVSSPSNAVYCGSPTDGANFTSVREYEFNALGTGSVTWNRETNYPYGTDGSEGLAFGSLVYLNNYLYGIGGYDNGASLSVNTVYYSPISASGLIGSWSTTNSYPARFGFSGDSCAGFANTVYCIGGSDPSQNWKPVNQIWSATQLSNGALTKWVNTTTNYPASNEGPGSGGAGCSTYNGYIYCMGNGPTTTNAAYYSALTFNFITVNNNQGTYAYTIANQIANGVTYYPNPSSGTSATGGVISVTFSTTPPSTSSASVSITSGPSNAIADVGQYNSLRLRSQAGTVRLTRTTGLVITP